MTGSELIAKERRRQIGEEHRTAGADDYYNKRGELAAAAACYAMPYTPHLSRASLWPWSKKWWKPGRRTKTDRIRQLVKAGALIAAEIDRLQRQP